MGSNSYENGAIYSEILATRKCPEGLFIAPEQWMNAFGMASGLRP